MARLELAHVYKKVSSRFSLHDVSLEIGEREILVLLGPSGCGKSTTLRLVAGLERVDSGTISMGGRLVSSPEVHVEPRRRDLALVFQSLALWPHMRAARQLRFVLKGRDLARREREERVRRYLDMVGLWDRRRAYPHHLSGGELQRLALARALVVEPSLVLLDEPLSAADRGLRSRLLAEIRSIQQDLSVPMVYVTHDQEEALALADRVVVMKEGRVEQVGSPREIYEQPETRFVATFVGTNNVLKGTRENDQHFRTILGQVKCEPGPNGLASSAWLSVRPEGLRVDPEGVECVVEGGTYKGDRWLLQLTCSGERLHVFDSKPPRVGDRVGVRVVGDGVLLRDAPGESTE